ncbi:MAG: hypothetical protein ABJC26_01500 [Gemmatimonadaceae bacterium]
MKRSILFTALGVAAIAAGYAGQSAFASSNARTVRIAAESCQTENGRSGYMVATGRGEYICMEDPANPGG